MYLLIDNLVNWLSIPLTICFFLTTIGMLVWPFLNYGQVSIRAFWCWLGTECVFFAIWLVMRYVTDDLTFPTWALVTLVMGVAFLINGRSASGEPANRVEYTIYAVFFLGLAGLSIMIDTQTWHFLQCLSNSSCWSNL